MAKIKASLADVSTEFTPIEPGIYNFNIKSIDEQPNNGKFNHLDGDDPIAYIVKSEILSGDNEEMVGKVFSDYINIRMKDGSFSEPGLSTIKRYFETIFGKDEVADWTDEDYDTDALIGRQFKGQLAIESYTPKGQTEPRKVNNLKAMEAA